MPKGNNSGRALPYYLTPKLLLQIINMNPTSITIVDKHGKIIFANRQAEKVLGLKKDAITRRTYNDPLWKITDYEGRPIPDAELPFSRVKKTGKPVLNVKVAIKWPDERRVFLSISSSPLLDETGAFHGIVASLEDVTGAVVSKLKLERSEDRYRQLFDRILSGVAIYQAVDDGGDFIIKDFNRAAQKIESIKKQDIIGEPVSRVFPGIKDFGLFNVFKEVYETGRPRYHPVTFYKDERISGWRENYVYKLPSGEIVAVYDDRTKEKQAEILLRESEAMLKSILRAAPIGIGVEHERVFTWANPMLYAMTGYSESELKGKNARMLYLAEEEFDFVGREKYSRIRRKGTEKETVETVWRRKDGKVIDVLLSFTALNPHDPAKGVIFTALDITRRKHLQETLRHTEKMLALGQLAGGIAHDFNNQLLGIFCYTDLLREELKDSPLLLEYVEHISAISGRAARLVDQLLSFSRKGKDVAVRLDIHKVLTDVILLLQHTISKRIVIKQNLKAAKSMMVGNPSQLQNLFLNLALNARDAMPEGGELSFSTNQVNLNTRLMHRYHIELPAGSYLRVNVADTGHGMDERTQKRIFEPFFTTKEQGKGTGMGLAAVQGAVKSHRGEITVFSVPGKGTTFIIFFPL
jgi:PAS domain S-box-containing protein